MTFLFETKQMKPCFSGDLMIATFLPVDLYKAEITPLIGESTKIAALKNFFESDLINV